MSFNPLPFALSAFTPPLPDLSEDYDGLEYRWKMFTFRPALFQLELYFLAAVLVYVAFYLIGSRANTNRADKWIKANSALYESQFVKPIQPGGVIQDGNSDFFVFSTGRRAISALHTTFTFRPRHDFFQLVYQILWGFVELDYNVYDEIELNFTFKDSASIPDCVWAIVTKDELKNIKNKRWDLTFTKTTENASLSPTLSVMSEFADITENLLKPHGLLSLSSVLSNPAILPYFRSLSLTDQPRGRPIRPLTPAERSKHLILTLAAPPNNETQPLVLAAFQLLDVVAGEGGWGIGKSPATGKGHGAGLNASLRPETRTKLKKVREELDKELKEETLKEKREEQADEKAAAKKKAEEERMSKLSAVEQKKVMEREKKRAMRKTQTKTKVR